MSNNSLTDYRANQIRQGELWEELSIEGTWVHLLRSMFLGEDCLAAKIGSTSFFVYAAIKCHADINTGSTFPAIETIARQTNLSHDTVQRSIKTLITHGLIKVTKYGRNNHYTLIEQVPLRNKDTGEPFGTAQMKYEPKQFQSFINELKDFAESGNPPGNKAININVTVNIHNINQGDGGTVNITTSSYELPKSQDSVERNLTLAALNRGLKNIS